MKNNKLQNKRYKLRHKIQKDHKLKNKKSYEIK